MTYLGRHVGVYVAPPPSRKELRRRKRTCKHKTAYTIEEAEKRIAVFPVPLTFYKCQVCGAIHLTKADHGKGGGT